MGPRQCAAGALYITSNCNIGGVQGILTVETIARVRREQARGKSVRAIARDLRLSRDTVTKYLRSGETEAKLEFRAKLTQAPHTWIEWASSQLLRNTPLHPIAEWGRQRFGSADIPGEKQRPSCAS